MSSLLVRSFLITFMLLVMISVIIIIPEEKILLKTEINNLNVNVTDPKTIDENALEEISKVRVLCMVLTSPKTRLDRAKHIERTWGKRCNKLLLMSSRMQTRTFNVIALPVDEGRENLWRKVRAAFKYVYENHFDDADWFMKTDDDTYMVMDNLRYMLYAYSPSFPVYFGYRFKPFTEQGYMAGGSEVFSKEALKRFMNDPDPDSPCNQDIEGADDVEIGKCMEKIGVVAGDGRDSDKRERFFPVHVEHFIEGHGLDMVPWFKDYMYYKVKEGIETPSDTAVAFHYTSPQNMYVLEYLIYHLGPIGQSRSSKVALPKKVTFDEMMCQLKEAEEDRNLVSEGDTVQ